MLFNYEGDVISFRWHRQRMQKNILFPRMSSCLFCIVDIMWWPLIDHTYHEKHSWNPFKHNYWKFCDCWGLIYSNSSDTSVLISHFPDMKTIPPWHTHIWSCSKFFLFFLQCCLLEASDTGLCKAPTDNFENGRHMHKDEYLVIVCGSIFNLSYLSLCIVEEVFMQLSICQSNDYTGRAITCGRHSLLISM